MSMRINIENILKSHKRVFEEILNKLQAQTLTEAKLELQHTHTFDHVLFDAINLTLKKLHQEEHFVSRLLYRSFGIGKEKNKRREQLIILGSELKVYFSKERQHYQNLLHLQERLNSALKNLKRLRKALKDKVRFLTSSMIQDRAYLYIQNIDDKIQEIMEVQKAMERAKADREKTLKIYEKQLKKIPRYQELQEETYLALLECQSPSS